MIRVVDIVKNAEDHYFSDIKTPVTNQWLSKTFPLLNFLLKHFSLCYLDLDDLDMTQLNTVAENKIARIKIVLLLNHENYNDMVGEKAKLFLKLLRKLYKGYDIEYTPNAIAIPYYKRKSIMIEVSKNRHTIVSCWIKVIK